MTKFQEKHSIPAVIIDHEAGSKVIERGGLTGRQWRNSQKKARRTERERIERERINALQEEEVL